MTGFLANNPKGGFVMAKFMFATLLAACNAFAGSAQQSWKDPNLAIQVNLYRGYPPAESFTALTDLGQILVQNTAKGFIVRSVVDRNDVHPGATFCMQVHPGLYNAKEIHAQILTSIQALKPEGQFVEFYVESPSSCLSKYFP